jgi:filamentous hemagglutinin family protein
VTCGRAIIAGALALVGALLPAAVAWAQITHDGSLAPAGPPLTGPNFVIDSVRGRIEGNKNLFHSFGQFNVGEGGSATFTGPSSILNVISRVTGGQRSTIDGLIDTRTSMPSASFFLLNPAGIMLGPSASLNVGGAFHLSTADYLCLGSGGCLLDPAAGKFFARLGQGDVFTVAAPAAFGFLGPPTGSIVVDGSMLFGDPSVAQTMSLVGGPIQVTNAFLSAPGGRVQLVSVNSRGEVPISSLDLQGFSALGSVTVTASTIDVSGDTGGSVVIRGGNLVIDATTIVAATGAVDGAPVGIELSAAGSLSITNGSGLIAGTTGDGRGGAISLSGNSVELTNGSAVRTVRAGNGASGDVTLTGETVTITGGSGVLSENFAEGAARSGNISATATGAMRLAELSTLQSTGDPGDGAQVSVSAGSLTLESGATIQSIATAGRGGDVVVTAPLLTLRSSAQISSEVQASGRGGDVRVVSTGAAVIEDPFTRIATSSSFFDPEAPGLGLPGNVSTRFGSLTLTGGGTIQSGVFAGSQGGSVTLVATGPVVISNGSGIASEAFFNDVGTITVSAPQIIINNGFISTSTLQSGRAGDISITAGTLTLENGGQIASASIAEALGRGGDVHLNVGSLTISGRSPTGGSVLPFPFSVFFTDPRSGIYSTTAGSAPGGNITIGSAQIQLLDGGTISASSTGEFLGSGPAGHIDVSATGSITITGSSPTGASGFFSTTAGTGPGGNITLRAAQLQLADGGTISSSSASTTPDAPPASGPAGHIDVTASESITITGASPTGASGLFSTTADTGPGGNITLRAPQIQLAAGGTISAASTGVLQGSGPAGQIDVTAGESITITGASPTGQSGIFSTTAGTGPGGNITLGAAQLQLADGGTISASSTGVLPASGSAGQINVTAGESITITGVSPIGQSGLFSTTAGTGPGGNITVGAPQIQLADGGTISASSTGGPSATAGSIDITFGDQFVMDHASISTDSLQADGGNITITSTGSLLHLIDSQITTSVRSGVGGGGNITLGTSGHPLQFLVLDHGDIHADAFGGPGGNINIFANVLLSNTPIETAITASSRLSAPGTVNISAVVTDISQSVPTLSTEVLEAAALLRASCAARLAEGKTSSLVVAGREGVPLEPGGLVPSMLMEPRSAGVAGSAAPFLAGEWPGLRLSYLDAACGR